VLDGLIWDGSGNNDAIIYLTDGSHHIRLINGEIRNSRKSGVYVSPSAPHNEFLQLEIHHNGTDSLNHGLYIGSPNNVIERNVIHHNSGYGIHLYESGGRTADRNVVRHNRVYDDDPLTEGGGIIVTSGEGSLVSHNVVWGLRRGIRLDYRLEQATVFHNTMTNNREEGLYVGEGSSGAVISNNIVWNNGRPSLFRGPNTTLQANFIDDTDPLFADAAQADFRLCEGPGAPYASCTGRSPAIDAGVDVELPFHGAAPDLGALESGGPPPVPGDLNDDGQVTPADLRLLMQMLIGQGVPSAAAKALAVPGDRLTLGDARVLIQLLVQP
jgi:parallel beta-helix repeat protein